MCINLKQFIMKKGILLLAMFTFSIISFSQDKKIDKIKSCYEKSEYDKCISKSESYISSETKYSAPYFFIAMSYLKKTDIKTDVNAVKEVSKSLYKGLKRDDSDEYKIMFEKEISDFHGVLIKYAYNYYEANKSKSRFYYDYLAKIYQDTLKQYDEVVLNKEPRPDAKIIELTEKGEINQVDENGIKQGRWMKVYSNGVTAYEVFLKDNKPIGELKRYHENGKISSLLNYDKKGEHASAVFYNDNGIKISEGEYIGKLKTGKWLYFNKEIKIKEEDYFEGVLNGSQITFYDNGQIYDKKKFDKGVQIGVWEKYHLNGKPSLKAFLKSGLMDGSVLRYYKSGLIEVKGAYKNDLKEGKWIFYSEEGETDTIEYVNGKDVNEENVSKSESDEYKKNVEKSKTLLDPANFKNNPSDYINK